MNEARAAGGYPRETAFSEKLRTIFGLTLGPWGTTALAPDGQPYVTLEGFGHEQEAAEAFSAYRASRPGDATVLHWRCQPEIACRGGRHTYFMRLLIALPAISPELDKALDDFVADKPKDIMR